MPTQYTPKTERLIMKGGVSIPKYTPAQLLNKTQALRTTIQESIKKGNDTATDPTIESIQKQPTRGNILMQRWFGLGNEPATEALNQEDIYPGIGEGVQVGSGSYRTLGTRPLFAATGGYFPFEIVQARKRALERVAVGVSKKQKEIEDTFKTMDKVAETDFAYQPQYTEAFSNFINNTYNETAQRYGGNGMTALQVLTNPATKEGREFKTNIDLFNSYASNIKGLAEQARKVWALSDNGATILPERYDLVKQVASGLFDVNSIIEGKIDTGKLLNELSSTTNIYEQINSALSGVKADITEQIKRNGSLGIGIGITETQKKSILSDTRLEEIATALATAQNKEQGYDKDMIKRIVIAKTNNISKEANIIKDTYQERVAWGEREKKVAEYLHQGVWSKYNDPAYNAKVNDITNSSLSSKEKGNQLRKDTELYFGLKQSVGNPNEVVLEVPLTPEMKKTPITNTLEGSFVKIDGVISTLNSAKSKILSKPESKRTPEEVNLLGIIGTDPKIPINTSQTITKLKSKETIRYLKSDGSGRMVNVTWEEYANDPDKSKYKLYSVIEYGASLKTTDDYGQEVVLHLPVIINSYDMGTEGVNQQLDAPLWKGKAGETGEQIQQSEEVQSW